MESVYEDRFGTPLTTSSRRIAKDVGVRRRASEGCRSPLVAEGDVTASAKPRIIRQDMICDVVAPFGESPDA